MLQRERSSRKPHGLMLGPTRAANIAFVLTSVPVNGAGRLTRPCSSHAGSF